MLESSNLSRLSNPQELTLANRRRLQNPPIKEAAIEFRFRTNQDDHLEATHALLAEFPGEVSDLWETMFAVRATDGRPDTQHSMKPIGKRIAHNPGGYVIQVRSGHLTFSKLPPYLTFDEVMTDALRAWATFASCVSVEAVTRIGVRFINEIAIPSPVRDLDDFLTAAPPIPSELPQTLTGFLTRLAIPNGSDLAVVLQSNQPPVEPSEELRLLLDIDVCNQTELVDPTADQLQEVLVRLRNYKNSVFFSFLTEKALEPYA